jgi:hypothetical protein
MYAFIIFLNLVRKVLGFLVTLSTGAYLSVSSFVRSLSDKQIARIEQQRDKAVAKAKQNVVLAAQRVVQLEADVSVVEQTAAEKAFKKTVKLEKLK